MVHRVPFPNRGRDQLGIRQGAKPTPRKKTKSDSSGGFRKKGDQSRPIVSREIKAEIESGFEQIDPDRFWASINPDLINAGNSRSQRKRMPVNQERYLGRGKQLSQNVQGRRRQHKVPETFELNHQDRVHHACSWRTPMTARYASKIRRRKWSHVKCFTTRSLRALPMLSVMSCLL